MISPFIDLAIKGELLILKLKGEGFMSIHFRLQAILHERGMSQRELALKMNIRPSTINHLCSYKVNGIYFETLEQICRTLDIRLQDLIVFNDEDMYISKKESF